MDPHSLTFQTAGYSTTLFLSNAANYLFNFMLHLSLFLVLLIMISFSRFNARCRRYRGKLESHLFWNGSIRLFMEAYLDFALFSMLNIRSMEWPEGLLAVSASNYLACICFGLCASVPFILVILAIRKRHQW